MLYTLNLSASNGSFNALLKDIKIENGCVHGTAVGVFQGYDGNRKPIYKETEPHDYYAGGGPWVLCEFDGILEHDD